MFFREIINLLEELQDKGSLPGHIAELFLEFNAKVFPKWRNFREFIESIELPVTPTLAGHIYVTANLITKSLDKVWYISTYGPDPSSHHLLIDVRDFLRKNAKTIIIPSNVPEDLNNKLAEYGDISVKLESYQLQDIRFIVVFDKEEGFGNTMTIFAGPVKR